MTAKTMEDVLMDHQRQNSSSCLCGWAELGRSHPAHQAAALSAAGFGLVADAKGEALEEAAREIIGPSEFFRDGGTCRDIANVLLGRAAAVRGEG